jgi:Ca2+-binding RTX toxin-like protein
MTLTAEQKHLILLAQAPGGEAEFPAEPTDAEIEAGALATYETALANGASLEEAAQLAYQIARTFGASHEDARFAVTSAIEITYEAMLSGGATTTEAIAFVKLAIDAVGADERDLPDQREIELRQENFDNDLREPPVPANDPSVELQSAPPNVPSSPPPPISLEDGDLQEPDSGLAVPYIGIAAFNTKTGYSPPAEHLNLRPIHNESANKSVLTETSPSTPVSSEFASSSLTAGNGGVILTSGAGEDTLIGGSGSDILTGGAGNDVLTGGSGDDSYGFAPGFGTDSITDVSGASDRISGFSVSNLNSSVRQGDDLILGFYTGDSVTVKNHYQVGGEVEILVSGSDNYGLSGQTSGVKGQIISGLASTDESLSGSSGDDIIYGGDGADVIQGGSGNNVLYGGTGSDTAVLSGNFADYTVAALESGYLVTDSVSSRDGTNTIHDIENLQFADKTLSASAAVTTPDYVTGVLFDDSYSRWNADTSIGNSVSLTYSFMDALPSYYGSEIVSFSTLSTAQEAAARTTLGQFAEVSNLTFTEVSDTGNGGQLRFGGSAQTSSAGFAYAPSVDYTLNSVNYLSSEKSGDVFIANNQTSNLTLTDGSHGYYTMIHEVGHATGLTHTFEGTNQLSAQTENNQYSVMSYTSHPKAKVVDITGDQSSYSYTGYDWNPQTPMLYDIATLQYLYGADTTTRTGDDTYTFDPSTRVFKAIWDAGGADTLDASNYTLGSVIDLTPGSFSSIGIYDPVASQLPSWYGGTIQPTYSGENNVAISYGATIESGIGGSGNDTLIGNIENNTLIGGGGNDLITGGAGNDTLQGDAGDDKYILASGSGSDTITDSSGTQDQISGVTIANLANAVHQGDDLILSFSTGDKVTVKNHFVSGNEVEIFLSGSDSCGLTGQTTGVVGQIIAAPSVAASNLTGSANADVVFGSDGADTLQGGAGDDTLIGGAGNDTFYFVSGDGNDVIKDFSKGYDKIQLDSTSFGISAVSFEAIAGTYDGTNASGTSSNVIRDSNNDVFVDNNGQAAGGYSLAANVQNGAAVDEQDIELV